jgi:hypothetical protein
MLIASVVTGSPTAQSLAPSFRRLRCRRRASQARPCPIQTTPHASSRPRCSRPRFYTSSPAARARRSPPPSASVPPCRDRVPGGPRQAPRPGHRIQTHRCLVHNCWHFLALFLYRPTRLEDPAHSPPCQRRLSLRLHHVGRLRASGRLHPSVYIRSDA